MVIFSCESNEGQQKALFLNATHLTGTQNESSVQNSGTGLAGAEGLLKITATARQYGGAVTVGPDECLNLVADNYAINRPRMTG